MTLSSKTRGGLLLAGRILLAGIFIAAGYFKLREPWLQFAVSLNGFRILPDAMLEPVAKTLPWLELALGLAILSGVWLRRAAGHADAGHVLFRAGAFFRDGAAGGLRVFRVGRGAGAKDAGAGRGDAGAGDCGYDRGVFVASTQRESVTGCGR